jgi:four helix bundle protein
MDSEETRFRLDDFELYQVAREYRKKIYRLAKQLPSEERFCLHPQMRRAALSISNNIAEGHGRWYYQDNIRFCLMSRGSVDETLDDLNTCLDENYGDSNFLLELKAEGYQLIKRINGYIAYLRRTKQGKELMSGDECKS